MAEEPLPPPPTAPRPAARAPTPPSQRPGYVAAPAKRPSDPRPKANPPRPTGAAPTPAASPRASADPERSAARRPTSAAPRSTRIASAFFIICVFGVGLFFVAAAAGVLVYTSIAREVPDPSQLLSRQSQFASTKIFDRSGNLLVELTDPSDPTAGRRQRVDLSQIAEVARQATLATEDPNFYRYNVGFDPIAILRAIYYVITERDIVSGGSTITQQVARNLLLDGQERNSQSAMRKLREIVLANELSRLYPRDKILEIYLNEINYGNLAYGIEAAAQTYFNKPASALNLAEASLLAGLPQAPSYWDPVLRKDRALRRQQVVLELMAERGVISESQIEPALDATRKTEFKPPRVNSSAAAPHFMNYVRDQLDAEFGQQLYRDGLRVRTTLDANLQAIAERAVREQIGKLKDKNVTNGAAVVMDPRTGEILAMVGSVDFYSETIKGQVNVALMPRQPGSSIKPFTYLAAMEKGATPATVYWDRQTTFTNSFGQKYTPVNYDNTYHGAVLMREALARSLNVPAVLALNDIGLPAFFTETQKAGIQFPPNPAYGLAVTLGGAEARLLDMTAAYAVIANGGVRIPPTAIARVERADGALVRDYLNGYGAAPRAAPTVDAQSARARNESGAFAPAGALSGRQQVLSPEHAWLITSILSDDNARAKSFGRGSILNLKGRPAAVKTGTTNDFRDNLTLGFTPELVVGVWVGNTDNSEMKGTTGTTGAAPIWNQILEDALKGKAVSQFARPAGIIEREICIDGGHEPSADCPPERRIKEFFKADQPPLPPDPALERAARENNPEIAAQPPPSPQPVTDIVVQLSASVRRAESVSIRGNVNPPGFERYQVEFGAGDNPGAWRWISGPHLSPVMGGQITQWTVPGDLSPGRYTLRVTAFGAGGASVGLARFDVTP